MSAIKDLFEAQTHKGAFFEEQNIEQQYEVQRWLKARKKGTKNLYLIAIRAFMEYTGLSPKQLIDLAEEDRKKSARQRGDPEYKVSSFYDYLVNDYVQKGKGKTFRTPDGKKGLCRSTASSFANAIRGFYKQNGFPLILKLPKSASKKENFKLPLRPPDIKRLFDAMANLRDKAILLTIYFSGLGVNELCDLTFGDVAEGLQKNEEPLHLHLIRKKEEVEFDTFLGAEAIDALKAYLAQRRRDEETLRENSPLFILQHTTKRGSNKLRKIYPNLVEASFTNAALKAGLVTREKLDAADINPCRPHAVRAAFVSILKNAGANNLIVEYLVGHAIPLAQKPYWICDTNELAKIYKQFEKFLSINSTIDNQKLEELENEMQSSKQEVKKSQDIIEQLTENSKYKTAQITSLNAQLSNTTGQLNNVATLLTQFQDALAKLNEDMDFHRLEDIARFIAAKAPTREELNNFMAKRQIPQSILKRIELECVNYSPKSNQWLYSREEDTCNLIAA
jgi:integrase/recombinase XerD